jgi:hypothetical protein
MPKFQPPKYDEVTLAVPNTGIGKAITGIAGYRSTSGHLNYPLYKNYRDTMLIMEARAAVGGGERRERGRICNRRFNALSQASQVHSRGIPDTA